MHEESNRVHICKYLSDAFSGYIHNGLVEGSFPTAFLFCSRKCHHICPRESWKAGIDWPKLGTICTDDYWWEEYK